jgi:hypothetical protein
MFTGLAPAVIAWSSSLAARRSAGVEAAPAGAALAASQATGEWAVYYDDGHNHQHEWHGNEGYEWSQPLPPQPYPPPPQRPGERPVAAADFPRQRRPEATTYGRNPQW